MNQERVFQILLSPHISEKTSISQGYRQYAFKVAVTATKIEVRKAIEALFSVSVRGVNICNVKPKLTQFGRTAGKRSGWKKAYVTLAQGQEIDISEA